MEDFRFVHESPQSQQVHRKRPRLVTACDNCRIKKIRCVKPPTNEKCEACVAGNAACEFRDRERYFQERSRLIAGSTVGTPPTASRRPTTPSSAYLERDHRSPYDRTRRLDDSPPSSIYSHHSDPTPRTPGSTSSSPPTEYLYLKENRHSSEPKEYYNGQQYLSRSTSLSYSGASDSSLWNYPSETNSISPSYPPTIPLQSSNHGSDRDFQLFEPSYPASPSFHLMPHFISLFFQNFREQCQYLSQDDILSRFYNQTLPATIANSIASLAVRYTDVQQLQSRGLRSVADEYSVNAKNNLATILHIASLDTLHALMLLSLSEYRRSQTAGYVHYADMAFRMGLDLGLDQALPLLATSTRERQRLEATWSCVLELHTAALSCTSVGWFDMYYQSSKKSSNAKSVFLTSGGFDSPLVKAATLIPSYL